MTTGLVLVLAIVLGLGGVWGTFRLLARLALDPAERLALALALFPAAVGLAAFAGLLLGRPGPLLPTIVAAGLVVVGWLARPSPPQPPSPASERGGSRFRLPLSIAMGRGAGGGVSCLLPPASCLLVYGAGALGTALLTPVSGGALRIGDWVAHWFLVLTYLGEPLPDLRTFINRVGDFGVISRPPLYNLEGGVLVGALDGQFWPFQLVTPLLALSVAAAAVLWARNVGGGAAMRVMVPLVGLSPFLLQNATYPWSKMVAGGLVLLFLAMIRAAVQAREPGRARQTFVLAALCAGLGYLAHQTTIFYVLPTLLWLVWRRPRALVWRPGTSGRGRSIGWMLVTWGMAGIVGLLAFAPWQAWVLATYGLRATIEANPAWFGADVSDTLTDWLFKGAVAAIGTLAPLPLLGAIVRGSVPTVDQALRVQLALLTGAFGVSGCWLLLRSARSALTPPTPLSRKQARGEMAPPLPSQRHGDPAQRRGRGDTGAPPTSLPLIPTSPCTSRPVRGVGRGWGMGLLRRPPWLALVVLGGFLGQVMLQPNWHDTGDAAESMTPIVVLGLAYVAREATRLGPTARRVFFGLVLAELGVYLGLWLWWAFSAAWTRDPNAVLVSRYGLVHIRSLWGLAVPLGAVLLAAGLGTSAWLLWRALAGQAELASGERPGQAGPAAETGASPAASAS